MTEPAVEVLLVQRDEHAVQRTLDVLQRHHLASRIHVVRQAADAVDFLFCSGPYAGRAPENPKLVLVDTELAIDDGVESLRQIREDGRTARLFVTAIASSEDARLAAVDVFRAHELDVPVVALGAWARPTGAETGTAKSATPQDSRDWWVPAGERRTGTDARRLPEPRRAEAVGTKELCDERDFRALAGVAGAIARECNNLLAVIAACTDLLLKDVDYDDPRHATADQIFTSVDRASRLTRQLLELCDEEPAANDSDGPRSTAPGRPRCAPGTA